MIYDAPKMTEEEYKEFKSHFYYKPNPPQIETDCQNYQYEVLVKNNYKVLKDFKKALGEYAKSILLKMLSGGNDYIDCAVVESMADVAAENFLKRYFRNDEPAVGASFYGILTFKVREVLSEYFKGTNVDSKMSLNANWGDDENSVSNETRLSYKEYLKEQGEEIDLDEAVDFIMNRVDRTCEELKEVEKLHDYKKLDTMFLEYLLYISLLQKSRQDKKVSAIATTAYSLVDPFQQLNQVKSNHLRGVLESAFLDVSYAETA